MVCRQRKPICNVVAQHKPALAGGVPLVFVTPTARMPFHSCCETDVNRYEFSCESAVKLVVRIGRRLVVITL